MVNSILSSLISDYLVGITRKLIKKSLMYCYYIYTNSSWFMLMINSLILMFIYQSRDKHAINIYLDIILSAPSPKFQAYDIISCDILWDYGYISFYYLRNQNKISKFKHIITLCLQYILIIELRFFQNLKYRLFTFIIVVLTNIISSIV